MPEEKSYLDEFLENRDNWVIFQQELIAHDFCDFIEMGLNKPTGVRVPVPRSVILKLLEAESELTLRDVVKLLAAVGYRLDGFATTPLDKVFLDGA